MRSFPRRPASFSRGTSPSDPGGEHDRVIAHDDTIALPNETPANDGASRPEAHQSAFSDERFWRKLTRFGIKAGREVVRKALQLYFVLKRPDVPLWAKSTIIGALGYFISPLDAIPDFIAGIGYTDDASVLAAALVAVSIYLDEDVKRRAEELLSRWWPSTD